VTTWTTGGPVTTEEAARLEAWLAAIPDDLTFYFACWHDVPWAERRSVRDRSRLVTRRKQRR
jgi:hypothetical protein